jgi:hypothetical protein
VNKLLRFLRLFEPHPWQIVSEVQTVADVPQFIPKHGIVCVGSGTAMKQIVFDCPCGSHHRIALNTDPKITPSWTLHRKGNRLWLLPEVILDHSSWRCQFRIENSQTVWPRDEGQLGSGG